MYRFNWWVNLVAKRSVQYPDRNRWITIGLISSSSLNSLDCLAASVLVLPGTYWAMSYMSLSMHQSQSSNVSSTSSMELVPPLWLIYETAVELSMFRRTVIWRWFFSNASIADIEPPFLCNIFSWADHLPFGLTPLETAPQPILDALVKIIISGDGGSIDLPLTWRKFINHHSISVLEVFVRCVLLSYVLVFAFLQIPD